MLIYQITAGSPVTLNGRTCWPGSVISSPVQLAGARFALIADRRGADAPRSSEPDPAPAPVAPVPTATPEPVVGESWTERLARFTKAALKDAADAIGTDSSGSKSAIIRRLVESGSAPEAEDLLSGD